MRSLHKWRDHVAKDQCAVALIDLVVNHRLVGTIRGTKLILTNVCGTGRQSEEESLNGNDINCVNCSVTIRIGGR